MGIPKRRNSFASNRYALQVRRKMSGRKISRTESWSRFHFAERTVQRGWSCKLQHLSGPHTVCERLSQASTDPATVIQALQGRSAKAVEGDVIKKANAVQFALPRLTRRAFRKESECRARPRDYKTTDPHDHWCDLKSASSPC